jgi:TolB protein
MNTPILRLGMLLFAFLATLVGIHGGNNFVNIVRGGGGGNCGFVAWSPDGTQVAFDPNYGCGSISEIYVADVDGRSVHSLTSNSNLSSNSFGAWSPDGSQIAFTSNREHDHTNFDVFVMDADGSNLRNLTSSSTNEYFLAWSPNGAQIMFDFLREDHYSDLFLIAADGSNLRKITDDNVHSQFVSASWSPDGTQIALQSYQVGGRSPEIFLMDANGSHLRNLTNQRADEIFWGWSSNGGQIMFASNRDDGLVYDIYVMDVGSSTAQNTTPNWWVALSRDGAQVIFRSDGDNDDGTSLLIDRRGGPRNINVQIEFGAWSPDGSQFAFAATLPSGAWVASSVYVVNADGSNLQRIVNTYDGTYRYVRWSPDGSRIAIFLDDYPTCQIFVVDADGRNLRGLTEAGDCNPYPAWSPDGQRLAFLSHGESGATGSDITVMSMQEISTLPTITPVPLVTPQSQ